MSDTVSWILNATLPPPPARFDSVAVIDTGKLALHFSASANLDCVLQTRTNLGLGTWTLLQDLSSTPTNRSVWVTNNASGVSPRFYRLVVGP